MEELPSKDCFRDGVNFLTQSLFYELTYDFDRAIYTLKDDDYVLRGKRFVSIKKLYLETGDPTEYEFANKYFYNWDHWVRCRSNGAVAQHVDLWKDELEVKLRSAAIREMLSLGKGNFNAAEWAADGNWEIKRGRPSKEDIKRDKKIKERITEEVKGDSSRVLSFVRKENV